MVGGSLCACGEKTGTFQKAGKETWFAMEETRERERERERKKQ